VDHESLWYTVLVARYDQEGGRVSEGGWLGSSWWKQILSICRGGGLVVGS